MSDGNYLIQSTGNNAYANGSITVWTIFDCTGSKKGNNLKWNGIGKVVYESNDKQSYIGRFTEKDYKQFAEHNADLIAGKLFGDGIDVVKTGASAPFTFTALTAAVNTAVTYFKQTIVGVSTEPDLYKHQNWIKLDESEIVPNAAEKTVTYALKMKANAIAPVITVNITVKEGKIESYSLEGDYVVDYDPSMVVPSLSGGSFFVGKDLAALEGLLNEKGNTTSDILKDNGLYPNVEPPYTGATYSASTIIRAAVFALENYATALYPVVHDEWLKEAPSVSVDDATVTYALKMKANAIAPVITVNITVKEGKIESYSLEGDYVVDYDPSMVVPSLSGGSFFVGKDLAALEGLLNEKGNTTSDILKDNGLYPNVEPPYTGATYSASTIIRAAVFALENYNSYLAKGGTQA